MTVSVPEASNQGVEPGKSKAGFPRSLRLLRHADFDRVYKQGRRHFSASMTVFYLERKPSESARVTAGSGLRVGFTVGRALGGAVQRNLMKRRLREAVRLTRPVAGQRVDVVINPKKAVLTTDFNLLLNEVQQAFVVINRKLGSGLEVPVPSGKSENRFPKPGKR